MPRRWTLHGLNNGAHLQGDLAGVRWLPKRLSYAIGDAARGSPGGSCRRPARRSPTTCARCSRTNRPRALERARAARCAPTRATSSISCARCRSTAERATALFDLPAGHLPAFNRVLAQGRGIDPRHRPLRQLGDRQRGHAARAPAAAHDRRDGRGSDEVNRAAARDPRSPRRRHHRGAEVARHGARRSAGGSRTTASWRC